jgi:hypothetical protein
MHKHILFLSFFSAVINCSLYAMEVGIPINQLNQVALNAELFEAVKSSDQGKIAELIAAKADVNAQESVYAWSVLEVASYGSTAIVEALINAKANVDGNPDSTFPPMVIAARIGNTDSLRALINAGADVNSDKNYHSLMYVISNNDVKSARFLIEAKADPSLRRTSTPLILGAAFNGATDSLQFLLDNGLGSLEQTDWRGETVLQCAGMRGNSPKHLRACEFLIERMRRPIEEAKQAIRILLGIAKRRSCVFNVLPKDMLWLIGQHVLEARDINANIMGQIKKIETIDLKLELLKKYYPSELV